METNHCVVILRSILCRTNVANVVKEHKAKPQTSCFSLLLSEVEILIDVIFYYRFQAYRSPCGLLRSSDDSIDVSKSKSFNELYTCKPTSKKAGSDRPKQTRHKTALLPTIRHCHRHHKIHSNRVPAP